MRGTGGPQRGGGAGRTWGPEGTTGDTAGAVAAPIRSIVYTSKGTPAALRASVTTSAGAEGSA